MLFQFIEWYAFADLLLRALQWSKSEFSVILEKTNIAAAAFSRGKNIEHTQNVESSPQRWRFRDFKAAVIWFIWAIKLMCSKYHGLFVSKSNKNRDKNPDKYTVNEGEKQKYKIFSFVELGGCAIVLW